MAGVIETLKAGIHAKGNKHPYTQLRLCLQIDYTLLHLGDVIPHSL